MEGLIPLVYRAIMQYKNGQQGMAGSWLNESPSVSYVRLPGDSGRFQMPDVQLLRPDFGFSTSSSSSPPSSGTKRLMSPGTTRRAIKWIYLTLLYRNWLPEENRGVFFRSNWCVGLLYFVLLTKVKVGEFLFLFLCSFSICCGYLFVVGMVWITKGTAHACCQCEICKCT